MMPEAQPQSSIAPATGARILSMGFLRGLGLNDRGGGNRQRWPLPADKSDGSGRDAARNGRDQPRGSSGFAAVPSVKTCEESRKCGYGAGAPHANARMRAIHEDGLSDWGM